MDAQSTPIAKTIHCRSCSAQATTDDQFCTFCGYPLTGTAEEQQQFLMDKSHKELNLEEARNQVRRASNAMYWVAGANMVGGLIMYAANHGGTEGHALLLINGIVAILFCVIGYWCSRMPLAGVITGTSLYALIFILNAVSNPLTIFSGIIFKIFIIGCFIRGIKAALEADKLKKELNIG